MAASIQHSQAAPPLHSVMRKNLHTMHLRDHWGKLIGLFCLFWALLLWPSSFHTSKSETTLRGHSQGYSKAQDWCPLPEVPAAATDGLDSSRLLLKPEAVERQVKRLSAAINVATASYDDNGDVDKDLRWEMFYDFQIGLEKHFPLVYEKAHRDRINKYGLLYTFPGRSSSQKPLLFMAHQDVVPAGSPAKWKHLPFHAYYDGAYLWGRGAADCKNNLIGLLSTMENLLHQGFEPKRTIVFAFGFDEETGGERGGRHIAAHLLQKFGKDGFAMIMDEGGMGVAEKGDVAYARPAIAEKGFVDILIDLDVNGGHSSRPPTHGGIGIMSEMVLALENHPLKPMLGSGSPFRNVLECEVRHSPRAVEPWLRRALVGHRPGKEIGRAIADSRGDDVRYAIQTSQAVTIVQGGEKDNQLPENVHALVNYRLAPHDAMDDIQRRVLTLLAPIAHSHGLAVRGFGHNESDTDGGALRLSSKHDLNPAPISPTGPDEAVWQLFAGTLRQVFEDTDAFRGKTVVPVGDIMLGNTDTTHYWDLSRNIYRFSPARTGTRLGIHTTDERVLMQAHVEGMRVYYELIRNFDVWEDV